MCDCNRKVDFPGTCGLLPDWLVARCRSVFTLGPAFHYSLRSFRSSSIQIALLKGHGSLCLSRTMRDLQTASIEAMWGKCRARLLQSRSPCFWHHGLSSLIFLCSLYIIAKTDLSSNGQGLCKGNVGFVVLCSLNVALGDVARIQCNELGLSLIRMSLSFADLYFGVLSF